MKFGFNLKYNKYKKSLSKYAKIHTPLKCTFGHEKTKAFQVKLYGHNKIVEPSKLNKFLSFMKIKVRPKLR